MSRARTRPGATVRSTWGCLLAGMLLVTGEAASGAEPPEAQRLPATPSAGVVAGELVAALARGDLAAFDRLAGSPVPPSVAVAAVLRSPPGREPSDGERAAFERLVARAPAEAGLVPYASFWSAATDELRKAERARWGLSARLTASLRAGREDQALALLEPAMPELRASRYSEQAAHLRRSYASLLSRRERFVESETEARALRAHLEEERRLHELPPVLACLAEALRGQGRTVEAVEVLTAMEALARRLGAWEALGHALRELGSLAQATDHDEEAVRRQERALAVATAAGHRDGALRARAGLARAELARGDLAVARLHLERTFAQARDDRDASRAGDAAFSLVELSLEEGRVAEAFDHGAWIEVHLPRMGDLLVRALCRRMLGTLAQVRGDASAAEVQLEGALPELLRTPATRRAGLGALGELLRGAQAAPVRRGAASDSPDRAVRRAAHLARYRDAVEREATGPRAAWILGDAADLEHALGNREEARALAARAGAAARGGADAQARHRGLAAYARSLLADGRAAEALTTSQQATAAVPLGSAFAAEHRAAEARALVALGRHAEARDVLRDVISTRVRRRVALAAGGALALRDREQELAMLGVVAAVREAAKDPTVEARAAAEVWWFREAGTARLLVEALASGPRALDPAGREAAAREGALSAALDAVEDAQRRLVVAVASGGAEPAALRDVVESAHARLRAAAAHAPGATAGPAVPPHDAFARARDSLEADEALLAFAVAGDEVVGLAADARHVRLRRLGTLEEISRLCERWLSLAATPGAPEESLARRLHDVLVGPFADILRPKARWRVLPAGPLVRVPLDALLRPGPSGSRRLIEEHTIGFTLSEAVRDALAVRASGRARAHGVVALGDPSYPRDPVDGTGPFAPGRLALRGPGLALPPLPASGAEARGVGELYAAEDPRVLLGEAASLGALRSALAGRSRPLKALHLACHGIVDDALPILSGLVLADGGVLTAERVAELEVPTEVAVLSSCDSHAGHESRGEGVLGLVRALLEAGATDVVCSAWQVADAPTLDLMLRFHGARAKEGLRPTEALRAARLHLMRAPATAHPAHWAGFQCWGSGAR